MDVFDREVAERISANRKDEKLCQAATNFMEASTNPKYCYNFSWLGRPIIQYPEDIMAMQELIYSTRPDLIIETGIAHGGSLIFSASMLALLDMSDAIENNKPLDLGQPRRKVLGVDIEIRDHNRQAIEDHPMWNRIQMIEGSSIDQNIIEQVKGIAEGYERILVCLDSNHTHEHVLAELEAYAPLASIGSYCVVFDTIIEDFPENMYPDRPWGPGNNPKTAVWDYLKKHDEFTIDQSIQDKLLITVAPDGYLRRVSK